MSVFPEGTLWLVGDGDVLLIGSNGPLEGKLGGVATAWQRRGVSEDLASVGVTSPVHVLSLFVATGRQLSAWSDGAPIQSDNRAALEFSGPQSIFGRSDADNAALLRELSHNAARPAAIEQAEAGATAGVVRDRAWMLLQADAFRPAYADFVRAVELDPTDPRTLEGLIRASAPLERGAETRALLSRLAADPTRMATKLALSRLLASQGAYDQAVADSLRHRAKRSQSHAGARATGVDSLGSRRRREDAAGGRAITRGGAERRSHPLLQCRAAFHGATRGPGAR